MSAPPGFPPPPVWRAGANVSTRLETEVSLAFGDRTVPEGEYSLFIDLKPSVWTLIVSSWPAQQRVHQPLQIGPAAALCGYLGRKLQTTGKDESANVVLM